MDLERAKEREIEPDRFNFAIGEEPLTSELILEQLGFRIAAVVEIGDGLHSRDSRELFGYHAELTHYVSKFGKFNVFGSLCVHDGIPSIGIFVRNDVLETAMANAHPDDDDGLSGVREPRQPTPFDDRDSAAAIA